MRFADVLGKVGLVTRSPQPAATAPRAVAVPDRTETDTLAGSVAAAPPRLPSGLPRSGTAVGNTASHASAVVSEGRAVEGCRVHVRSGNIVALNPPVDAVITPIHAYDPRGWNGGVDKAIKGKYGDAFHRQAEAEWLDAQTQNRDLPDGHPIVAHSDNNDLKNVVFVIDNAAVMHQGLKYQSGVKPLREIVLAGLRAADKAGFRSVALPVMRTGCAAGAKETSVDAVMREMALGIAQFQKENPANTRDISIVVNQNPRFEAMLNQALQDVS